MRKLLAAMAIALTSCGKEPEGDSALSKRPLKKEHLDLVQRFADAVVKKDYRAGFELTAADYKAQVGWDEFEKSIRSYRDSTAAVPKYRIQATEDDPKAIVKDGVVELFVPEPQRKRIVEEAAIHFTVSEGKDDEGFWALICWIVEDPEGPRILNYYQDD